MIKLKIFLVAVCIVSLAATWPVKMLYGEWVVNKAESRIFGNMIFKADHSFVAYSVGKISTDTFSGTYTFKDGVLSLKKKDDPFELKTRVVELTATKLALLPADKNMVADTIVFTKKK